MELKYRLNNRYFDKKGTQILEGDLLKVFHFKNGNKIHYMYQVVVIEETLEAVFLSVRDYNSIEPHCKLNIIVNKNNRVYEQAKIISKKDYETKRLKIKL